jgi:hypothetical protein
MVTNPNMEAAVSPKQWQPPTRIHGDTTQKTKPKLPLVQKNVYTAPHHHHHCLLLLY